MTLKTNCYSLFEDYCDVNTGNIFIIVKDTIINLTKSNNIIRNLGDEIFIFESKELKDIINYIK